VSGGIYLVHGAEGEERLVRMTERAYDSEDLLQDLLARIIRDGTSTYCD